MKKIILLLILAGIKISVIHAQKTYTNPIITGLASDPSICKVGEDFYLVTSTFEYFPGLPIYQSKDLIHWKLIGYVLTRPSQLPLIGCEASVGGLYAPTIRYNNGTFYVVCTNYGGQGSQGSFYVTSHNILGPWSEPKWVNSWACDPSLLFENDTVYYTFPVEGNQFMQTALDLETGKFATSPKKIATGLGGSSPEGPHLYKINGYYYLMSAEGGTGYEHREVIQRSKTPWGPFEVSPYNPLISHMNYPNNPFHAIGHADIIETADGWWLVCLGIRPKDGRFHHLGRETFLAPVIWTPDGWPIVNIKGTVPQKHTRPNLPLYTWQIEPSNDLFDSTELRLHWNFVRNPYAEDWSLTERKGYLRLHGSALSFKQKDSPAFICRRQTAFNVEITTDIDFTPTLPTEEAGLVIRGNDKNHYDLLITLFENKRVVVFRQVLKDSVVSIQRKEIPEGEIILSIKATETYYYFSVLTKDGQIIELGSALTKDLSTEVINGFTGVFIGMYASGNGEKCKNPADFDWFNYSVLDEE